MRKGAKPGREGFYPKRAGNAGFYFVTFGNYHNKFFLNELNQQNMELLYILLIGAIAGWLAGQIWKGGGFGLLWNIIIGIVGSFVGGWLLNKLGISINLGGPTISLIITSVIGAVVILFVAGLFKKR